MKRTHIGERVGKYLFVAAGTCSVLAVVSIFSFLILRGLPALRSIGLWDFVLGTEWSPDRTDTYDSAILGSYGILPMIAGTAAATLGALLFGGVGGFFTAVFLVFFCPVRYRAKFSTVIYLLAGIPSVVYGFFGIVLLLPFLARFAPNNGGGLLAVSLILGLMILPTVVSLSRTALEAVPDGYKNASVALGATETETVFRVAVPAARSGISAAFVLGVGRALGETMAVVMVAGNAPIFPEGLFRSFRVLTANIVMEMGYAGEVQQGALVATGVILLCFVLLVNLAFGLLLRRNDPTRSPKKRAKRRFDLHGVWFWSGLPRLLRAISILFGIFSALALVLILGFLLVRGLPPLLSDAHLLFGRFELGSTRITLLPAIVTTVMVLLLSVAIALPIGVMTAILLNEYVKPTHPLVRLLRLSIDVLGGVPSIVYGLFGMIAFLPLLGGSSSILAGALTVSMMLLPTVIRATEESLAAVDDALRAGSLALGAGKLRTVLRIVIPSASAGILSALILSMGRVMGESAPFLYTMGSVITTLPRSYLDSGATLAVALYQLSGEGWYLREGYAAAALLILLILPINLLSMRLLRTRPK